MIRIFRLRSRSGVPLQRKKSAAPSRGRYLGVCLSNYPLSGEDSAELRPDHPHVVRLETRPANQEGAGLD